MTIKSTIVQIVLRLYGSPAEVVGSFDLAPCKIAAWVEETGNIVIKAAPIWVDAVRYMTFPVDLVGWGEASVSRIFKYISKGFDAMVPGARRAALKTEEKSLGSTAIGSLFLMESMFKAKRRPLFGEVIRILNPNSDYGTIAKFQRRMYYIVTQFIKKNFSAIFGRSITVGDEPIAWAQCDRRNIRKNIFRPANPLIHKSFNTARLAELLDRTVI